jgi:hypothetical protein
MKDKFLSIFDVFSDENNCPQCQYGKYELYDIPSLCWDCYDNLMIDSLENEWLSIDTPVLG